MLEHLTHLANENPVWFWSIATGSSAGVSLWISALVEAWKVYGEIEKMDRSL